MNMLNFQTFLILICFLLSISQTYHHRSNGNNNNEHVDNEPNCDYVVQSDNLGDPIGVCIAMGEKESYRTDYDETIGAVHLKFNSNDCTGKSEEYFATTPNSDLIEINLGTGNLCKTYGATAVSKVTSKTDGVISEGGGFDTMLFGRCKYSASTGIYYIVDYCKKDIMVHWRWFFDDECSDEIPKEKYVSINQDNDDIVWKTIYYWRAVFEGVARFYNEDKSSVWEVTYDDIQCVGAQNNNNDDGKYNKKNRRDTNNGRNQNEASSESESRDNAKGSSWSKY